MKEWVALPTNEWVRVVWQSYYMAIFRANTVIKQLQDATFDKDLKEQYIAEAKFVRAYSYLTLVKLFGDLPLIKTPLNLDEVSSVNRAPFEDVFALIKTDFEEATKVLPEKWSEDQIGRATSGAAQGLEARAIMYAIGMF